MACALDSERHLWGFVWMYTRVRDWGNQSLSVGA